ncbi:hypothetical protein M9979_00525 [Sphingomonas sp. RP10(2022)]|uniref:Uncharacterized protein n=1 Tax=Sphingomonas liriopis TaxID=2949094 RepID=A0A9X2HVC2_9SPHN|nr:hypothetical protein [Sphingomonas liriopis]MCP3733370.1 hypothetical protein [Sphingomonas liriopis]
MPEPVTNDLIYAVLQKLQADMTEVRFDIGELKARATATDEHLGNMLLQMTGLNRRLDRVEERLGRVERRLDLVDHR